MEIRGGNNLSRYDSQHIAHVQREIAHSVKPNVLRQLEDQDLSEEAFERLLDEDLVELSPEAKELLKNLRKQRKGKRGRHDDALDAPKKDFLSLLAGLEEFRRQVEEDDSKEADLNPPTKPKPFLPPVIALSTHMARPETLAGSGPRAVSHLNSRSNGQWLNRAGELAKKMVAIAPQPELKERIAFELQVFGETIVGQMKQFGTRVVVLGPNTALTDLRINGMMVVAPSEKTFDGRPWGTVRGLYDPSRRMLVVGQELIGLPDRSTARHEFAHAYDHYFQEKNHRKQPLSVQLWNSFRQERSGLISDYAAVNPQEYFAESVEAFFQPGLRENLRSSDPRLFDYLTQLFSNQ